MANNKIKIVGRNFNDDLVGNQFTSNGGTSLFTIGNFEISTNLEEKKSKTYKTGVFSEPLTLESLDITASETKTLIDSKLISNLNFDRSDLSNYAYFGSLSELVRVSLENIILYWPASIYVNNIFGYATGNTVNNYSYTGTSNESSFNLNTNFFDNNFNINYLSEGSKLQDTDIETNELRNLTIKYKEYVITVNDVDYPLLGFTGSTRLSNDQVYFKVQGNPFPTLSGGTTQASVKYHIRPKEKLRETFFNDRSDFESYLLNRLTTPKYSSFFTFPIETDEGLIIESSRKITWPVNDGYNIDINGIEYSEYVEILMSIVSNYDLTNSNIINRLLTSESINSFDSLPKSDGDELSHNGQKVTNLLHIYGREFDEVKKYIDGISNIRTVTYDKKNNVPDSLVKDLAKMLGWDTISSISDNKLFDNIFSTESTYTGQTVGLSKAESDVELWRRLILNTAWLWKSKGTRKAIEFLFRFIGAPEMLMVFNEHIYVVEKPVDVNLIKNILEKHTGDDDISGLHMDNDGYPYFPSNNEDFYFQMAGNWYRETSGENADIDLLKGNNPHMGPYDGGKSYFSQLNCLVPDFSSTTMTDIITYDSEENLFVNYKGGKMFDDCEVVAPCENIDNLSWTGLTSGVSTQLNQQHFINDDVGWVVGHSGVLLKTTDGGDNWTPKSVDGISLKIWSLWFIDNSTGWVCTEDERIYKTTDGGDNWVIQYSGATNFISYDIYFKDANNGIVVGSIDNFTQRRILKTTDGGTSWSPTTTIGDGLRGTHFNGDTGWAVGGSLSSTSAIILKTNDFGVTWTPQTSPVNQRLVDVHAIDSSTAIAVGYNGTIIKTINGGTTWLQKPLPTGASPTTLLAVWFHDRDNGWISTINGIVYRTTDGGDTWEGQYVGQLVDINGIFFTDSTTGYAVGTGGNILKLVCDTSISNPEIYYDVTNDYNVTATLIDNPSSSGFTTDCDCEIEDYCDQSLKFCVESPCSFKDYGKYYMEWDSSEYNLVLDGNNVFAGHSSGIEYYINDGSTQLLEITFDQDDPISWTDIINKVSNLINNEGQYVSTVNNDKLRVYLPDNQDLGHIFNIGTRGIQKPSQFFKQYDSAYFNGYVDQCCDTKYYVEWCTIIDEFAGYANGGLEEGTPGTVLVSHSIGSLTNTIPIPWGQYIDELSIEITQNTPYSATTVDDCLRVYMPDNFDVNSDSVDLSLLVIDSNRNGYIKEQRTNDDLKSHDVNCTDMSEFKIIMGSDQYEGTYLSVDADDDCKFSVEMDIMFNFDCQDLIDCAGDQTIYELFSGLTGCITVENVSGSTPSTIQTVNVYDFDIDNQPTGVYLTSDNDSCNIVINQLKDEVGCDIIGVNTFIPKWTKVKFDINSSAHNEVIKLGILVKNHRCDMCVLVDNVKINRVCTIEESRTYTIDCPSFELERVVDNKKSWVYNEDLINREFGLEYRLTDYYENHSKLVLNTKEVDIELDPASAIECDVFNYISENDCILSSSGVTNPYPEEVNIDPTGLNKIEFKSEIISQLIDVKSRQVMSGYPLLRLLYEDYIDGLDKCGVNSSQLTYDDLYKLSDLVIEYWVDLIEQLIPATTIWGGVGRTYRNTIFDSEKFNYRRYNLNLYTSGDTLPSDVIKFKTLDIVTTEVIDNDDQDSCKETDSDIKITDYDGIFIRSIYDSNEYIGKITVT